MRPSTPEAEDYLRLFKLYGDEIGLIYKETDGDRYALLFEQVVKLLIKDSPFNATLPQKFRMTSLRYDRGDPATVRHLKDAGNRHFMLSDLYDLIQLKVKVRSKSRETTG